MNEWMRRGKFTFITSNLEGSVEGPVDVDAIHTFARCAYGALLNPAHVRTVIICQRHQRPSPPTAATYTAYKRVNRRTQSFIS